MKEKTFDGATLFEAKQRAADWLKSTHGIKVTSSRVLEMHSGAVRRGETSNPHTRSFVVKYDGPE